MRPREAPFRPIIAAIAKNVAMALPPIRALRLRGTRTATGASVAGLPRYALDLLAHVEANAGPVAGRSVLEIGPGDNLLFGLAALARGASAYTAIDRFAGDYAGAAARAWYRILRAHWVDDWPADLDAETFPRDPRVRTVARPVEAMPDVGRFDLVCSHAVGQHVRDVGAFARFTARALAPGGVAIHLVDFSGHGWHRADDPWWFRRLPTPLWHAMGSNRGLPNRVPFAAFLARLRAAGLTVEVASRREMAGDVAEAVFVCRAACLLDKI